MNEDDRKHNLARIHETVQSIARAIAVTNEPKAHDQFIMALGDMVIARKYIDVGNELPAQLYLARANQRAEAAAKIINEGRGETHDD